MTIGVVSSFNPAEFKDYLSEEQIVPNINRAASSVNAVVLGLLQAGHKIIVITTYDDNGPTLFFKGNQLSVYLVSTYSNMPKAETFRKWYMVKRLRQEIAKHIEEMDLIHTHWTYDFALASVSFARQKSVFCTIRDWAPVIRRYQNGAKAKFMWWMVSETLFRMVMGNPYVHFIANSPYISELVKKSYPGISCEIIENPIKKQFIISKRDFYPETPTYISISQDIMEGRKNYEGLLHAFHLLLSAKPKAKLKLIGNYSTSSSVFRRWEQKGLTNNVEFLGFVDHESLIDILDHASALVHPSLEESFGNTLLEGMARRLPVIGGKGSGAVPYVLGHGKYGILCDVRDPLELSRAMTDVLDLEKMTQILDNATNYLISELTNEIIAKRHIRLFNEELKRR